MSLPDTPTDTRVATGIATRDTWYRRAAATGHWLRDTGLGMFGVALLVLVAAAGWGGSTLGLRDFADTRMGYHGVSAWLVPATFDGASVGLSIVAFRAAIHGRGAPLTRVGVAAFTSLSSWMNYSHITDHTGRLVAALLPVAGVALLESLLSEARKAYGRRHDSAERPRLHPLRLFFDWNGTWGIFRAIVLAIPLPGVATPSAVAGSVSPAATATSDTSDTATGDGVGDATVTPIRRTARVATATGDKTARMRAEFDRYVAEGRADELTGTILAVAAGANPSLGRRYLPVWRAELDDTATPSDTGEAAQ